MQGVDPDIQVLQRRDELRSPPQPFAVTPITRAIDVLLKGSLEAENQITLCLPHHLAREQREAQHFQK